MQTGTVKPVRILHLISTLDVGGGEQNLCSLVSGMDKTLFRNMAVSMTTIGPIGRQIIGSGVETHALNMEKGLPDPRGIARLGRLVCAFDPDIVHCWMYHANLLGLFFGHKRHLIWSILCSYMDLDKYGLTYKMTVHAGAVFSSLPGAVLTNSHSGREVHRAFGYDPKRWETIPNGFDTGIYKPDPECRLNVRSQLNIPQDAVLDRPHCPLGCHEGPSDVF